MDPKSEYDVIMEDEVKIAAVVPTRANSTRVRHKNTRKFGDSSLLSLTLAKLKQVRSIHKIIVSSNEEASIRIGENMGVSTVRRAEEFCTSECRPSVWTMELARQVKSAGCTHMLFCHCVCPFMKVETYQKVVDTYSDGHHTCVGTASVLKKFMFQNGGPLNFEFGDSMPRSQDLEPIYIPTFGAVLVKCDDVIKHCSILQRDTTFIEVDDIEAIDIDTNLDFFLSENLSRHRAATSELVDVLINHTGTHPKLLDCTIRDGGYETNFEFSPEFVAAAFNACAQHGVDFFEIGFRNTLKCDGKGAWYNVSDEDIDRLWPMLDTNTSTQLAIMVTCGRFTRKDFKPRRESKIQLIRVLVHREDGEYLHLDSAINDCKYLIGIGYEVCLNIANAESLSDEQISQVVHATVDVPQLCIYIADTFGNMCPREVEDILFRFRKIKGSSMQLGFHAHNHCGMANANSLIASACGYSMIDSTIGGLGKNAGNASTEYMILSLHPPKSLVTMKSFFELYSNSAFSDHNGRNLLLTISGSLGFHSDYVIELLHKFENDHVAIFDLLTKLHTHLAESARGKCDSSSDRALLSQLQALPA